MFSLEARISKIIEPVRGDLDEKPNVDSDNSIIKPYSDMTREERVEAVRSLAGRGLVCAQIAERLNCNYVDVYNVASYNEIQLKKAEIYRKSVLVREEITVMAEKGLTMKEIAEQLNLPYDNICYHACRGKIKIRRGRRLSLSKQLERESQIRSGLKQVELARLWGIRTRGVWNAIKRYGLYEEWKQAKKSEKEKRAQVGNLSDMINSIAGELVATINHRAYVRAGDGQWAEKMAFEYLQRHRRSSNSFSKLVELYSAYKIARDKGKRVSLVDFQELTGMHFVKVSSILHDSCLETLVFGRRERNPLSKGKKDALKRVAVEGTQLSATDVAYFLDVPDFVALQNLKAYGAMFSGGLRSKTDIRSGRGRVLTYRAASEIYEAIDIGFSVEEAAYLTDLSVRVVQHALVHRQQLAGEIAKTLRVLHPQRQSRKPYLST